MQDRVKFLLQSLDLIERTQVNADQVYAFWQKHIEQLDINLVQEMPDIARQILIVQDSKGKEAVARSFGIFGYFIQDFPLGNRGINVELAIASCQICASVITRAENPEMWSWTQMNLGNAYSNRISGERRDNTQVVDA